jgi:ribosomal protein S20
MRPGDRVRRVMTAAVLFGGLTLGLSGCRHKTQLAPLPPVLTPVALIEIPPMADPPMIEVPQVRLPPIPIAVAAAKPKREHRRTAPKVATAPTTAPAQVASAEPPPDVAAIGALTAGEDANPQTKQEASDLITSTEKRLNGLSAQMVEDEKAQISKVKNFLRDAQDALKSGDAEGAKTLATKAKLLLDDMEK